MVVWCMFEEVRSGAKSKEPNTHQGGSVAMKLRLATVSDPLTKDFLPFITTSLGGALFWGVDIFNS